MYIRVHVLVVSDHNATYCKHIATHHSTLHHTATQRVDIVKEDRMRVVRAHTAGCCKHSAAHCNMLHYITTRCKHIATQHRAP